MQKLIYGALFCAILSSCGSSAEENKEPESFDDMKKAVCDCFKEKTGGDRMGCAKIQDEYADTMEGEERKKFLLETNECM